MTKNQVIHETAVIGAEPRYLQGMVPWDLENSSRKIALPNEIFIGPYSVIGYGAKLHEKIVIDSYCKIDQLAEIGARTLVIYRATIGVGALIGQDCVIGGNVSENTIVEDNCRTFGKLIHTHWNTTESWDFLDSPEASPIIRKNSFVAHDATVIGGIEVGPNSYVCAGATISRTVPPKHIGFGFNKIVHHSEWSGKLATNPIFK